MHLLKELRRRRVFRTAGLYIVAAWVLLQVASLAFPALNIPEVAIRFVWFAAILGFPVALLFGWRYQISDKGIFRTTGTATSDQNISLKRADFLILSALLAITVVIGWRAVVDIKTVETPFRMSTFGREIHPNSVAVLRLGNLTGDLEQQFFVDGIHDALTAVLSQVSGLRVKSRTSTSVYKGVSRPLPEIADELGVANIIEGSVFRTGDEVQISVQLIDAVTDEHVWSQNYRRSMKDMLALQAEVAMTVADKIDVALTADEMSRLRKSRVVDPRVYELYLKGMYFVKRLDPSAIQRGLNLLHDAVGIDPREPLAYAAIALGYNTIGHGVNAHDAFPKALAAADKALELDNWSGEAWAALGEAQLYYEWDWASAEASLTRAIQLSPSLDHAYAHYAYLVALHGRMDEALQISEKARDLSPVDPIWAGFTAWLYMLDSQWGKAIETCEECLSFAPNFWLCQYVLGQIYSAQGQIDKALAAHESMPDGTIFKPWAIGITFALAGRRDDAMRTITAMQATATPRDNFHIALTYSALGDSDAAFEWFSAAFESRSDWLPWIALPYAYGGAVEPIRNDPRFQALIERLDLPSDGS
ncbi:MAG: hypothetical protein OER97_08335 [Gammaproteobacteria bacterium]|nr:hypothetical protein [Gammaproteobacteria bacterium]